MTAQPGSEIEIPLQISGNTGLMGLGITVGFDNQVLTPVDDVKQTNLLVGQFNNSIAAMPEGAQSFDVKWQGTDDMKEDGELFILKFRVADQASGTTKVTLTLLEDDTYHTPEMVNQPVNCEDITITIGVAEPTPTQAPATEAPNAPNQGTKKPASSIPKSVVNPPFTLPRKVTLKSVKKAGKKKLKVTWKWRPDQDGYQIQRARNRGFTKKRKTVSASAWSSKKTLSGLTSKKTYYVRVRAYKYHNGRKYYGRWSNVKKCKVK